MSRQYTFSIQLTLALFALNGSTQVWSDETNSATMSQGSTQVVEAQSLAPYPTYRLAQTSVSTPADWRDSLIDSCEDLPAGRLRRSAQKRGRPLARKCHEINDWFQYISGHGPPIWVRDSQ